jgi:hypothetical protein
LFTDQERQKIDRLRLEYQERVNAIRADKRYTPEGKRAAIAREYMRVDAGVRRIVEAAQKRRDDRIRTLQQRLFSAPGGNDPAAVLSFRDAMDRAERVRDATEAAALLDRAVRTNDVALQRAVLDRAFRAAQSDPFGHRGPWVGLLDRYREMVPSMGDDIAELAELTGAGRKPGMTQFWDNVRSRTELPSELAHLPNDQIAALAARAPSEAA